MKIDVDGIDASDVAFRPWRENFKLLSGHRRAQNILKAYNEENQLRDEYEGRELLEMIQNADDQKSSFLDISLSSKDGYVELCNCGKNCEPFSKRGFECLIAGGTSEKKTKRDKIIGSKGKGFRSLLNWATKIEIWSNGVHCVFSKEEAEKAWDEIRSHQTDDWNLELKGLEEEIAQIAKTPLGVTCPISILMAPGMFEDPESSMADSDLGWSTCIRVYFDASKLEGIKQQIEMLKPQFLLFVNSLQQIEIKIDDECPRILTREGDGWSLEDEVKGSRIESCVLRDGQSSEGWLRYVRVVGDQEVSIAWHRDNTPVPASLRVAYTYFPTSFQLQDLPCILHATFQLDSSRNGINKSDANKTLMRIAGECIVDVASWIAGNRTWNGDMVSDDKIWFPYAMLLMKDPGSNELLASLKSGIDSKSVTASVVPVVSRKYMPLEETACFGEPLARYLVGEKIVGNFANQVWPSFSAYGLKESWTNEFRAEASDLCQHIVQDISKKENITEDAFRSLVSLLESILQSRPSLQVELRMSCLPDSKGRMIPGNTVAYINSGRTLDDAADCLGIHYVNEAFVNCYKSMLQLPAAEWDNRRGLVRRLKPIVSCSSSDINPIKDYIVTVSEKGFPNAVSGTDDDARVDCFKKICISLYKVYSENPDLEGLGRRFRVMCGDGSCNPAGDVCLWDESGRVGIAACVNGADIPNRYRMKFSLQQWCSILEPGSDIDESLLTRIVRFWEKFVGISLGFPIKYVYCGDDPAYLQSQFKTAEVQSGEKLKAWYFSREKFNAGNDRSAESEDSQSSVRHFDQNYVSLLDEEFLEGLIVKGWTPIRLLRQLSESQGTYLNIIGKQNLWFRLRGDKPCTFQTSYMAWKLKRFKCMRSLEVREIQHESADDNARLVCILKALGLAKDLSNMTAAELYDRLAKFTKKIGVQNHYSIIRKALRDLIQRNVVTEDECAELAAKKLQRVYARMGRNGEVKLYDRQGVYYWDNAIVSRALLEQLPKLEIGGRVGAKSVEKLFGIHSLKADDVVLTEGIDNRIVINSALTNELKNALVAKRKYLIAARLKDTIVDDIDAEVKKLDWSNLSVVSPCNDVYRIKTDAGRTFSLEDGDVLQTPEVFWICTTHENLEDALSDRRFCDSVVEALCVRFGLTGTQIESSFREVLRNNEEENEYYGQRDVSDETWGLVKKAIGVPDAELRYWCAAAAGLGKKLSEDEARCLPLRNEQWKTVVAEWAGLEAVPEELRAIPDFPAMSCEELLRLSAFCKIPLCAIEGEAREKLYDYVAGEIDDIRFGLEKLFASALYEQLLTQKEKQQSYVENVKRFMRSGTWELVIDGILSSCTIPTAIGVTIRDGVKSFVRKEFGVEIWDAKVEHNPVPLDVYKNILNGRDLKELDFQIQSLVLFPDNGQRLEELFAAIDAEHPTDEKMNTMSTQEDADEELANVVCITKDDLKCLSSSGRDPNRSEPLHTKGQHFMSDADKRERGESAEKVAEKLLRKWVADGICEAFQPRSSISSTTENEEVAALADDGAHFDFWFKPKGERIRLLEVKAYSGSRILMSAGEYRTACSKRYADKYDLCLVKDGVPYYIKGPIFGKKSIYKSRISPVPETWSVRVTINK